MVYGRRADIFCKVCGGCPRRRRGSESHVYLITGRRGRTSRVVRVGTPGGVRWAASATRFLRESGSAEDELHRGELRCPLRCRCGGRISFAASSAGIRPGASAGSSTAARAGQTILDPCSRNGDAIGLVVPFGSPKIPFKINVLRGFVGFFHLR